jgi:hypothetical protein
MLLENCTLISLDGSLLRIDPIFISMNSKDASVAMILITTIRHTKWKFLHLFIHDIVN